MMICGASIEQDWCRSRRTLNAHSCYVSHRDERAEGWIGKYLPATNDLHMTPHHAVLRSPGLQVILHGADGTERVMMCS
jgi:hypothetical protein